MKTDSSNEAFTLLCYSLGLFLNFSLGEGKVESKDIFAPSTLKSKIYLPSIDLKSCVTKL